MNIRILILKSVMIGSLAFSSTHAFAEVSEKLSHSASRLRQTQNEQIESEKIVQSFKEAIRSKKEAIRMHESLISHLRSDQKNQDKISKRDQGAGEDARRAYEVTSKDREERIQASKKALKIERERLAILEDKLHTAQGGLKNIKKSRKDARSMLIQLAAEEREAQACKKQGALDKMGSGVSALFDSIANVTRSRSERDEHEVQVLLSRAHCDPRHAVSERRQPKEKETDIYIPRATPVSHSETIASSAQ